MYKREEANMSSKLNKVISILLLLAMLLNGTAVLAEEIVMISQDVLEDLSLEEEIPETESEDGFEIVFEEIPVKEDPAVPEEEQPELALDAEDEPAPEGIPMMLADVEEGAVETASLNRMNLSAASDFTISGSVLTAYNGAGGDVVIPEDLGIKTIGAEAFRGNTALNSIVIPEGVTVIKDYAFHSCSALSRVILPSTLTTIGVRAFQGCTSLTGIDIPVSVTSIDTYAFLQAPLKRITIPQCVICGDSNYTKTDARGRSLPEYSGLAGAEHITIADGVTFIGGAAFSNMKYVKSISIPESVTSIYKNAFYCCYALEKLEIPKSVTRLDQEAIDRLTCTIYLHLEGLNSSVKSSLKYSYRKYSYLEYPDYVLYYNGIYDYIGTESTPQIPEELGVTKICAGAFVDPVGVIVPDCITEIEANAFVDGTTILSSADAYARTFAEEKGYPWQHHPHTYETVLGYAATCTEDGLTDGEICSGCGKVKVAPAIIPALGHSYENGVCACGAIPPFTYTIYNNQVTITGYTGSETDLVIPNQIEGLPVTEIGSGAFAHWQELKSIKIPDTVKVIGKDAFEYCIGLTSIEIPKETTKICDQAFYSCSSLANVTFHEKLTTIGQSAFYGCSSLEEIKLPEGLKTIGIYAFAYCYGLTDVKLPEGLTTIEQSAFTDCTSLVSVEIPESVTLMGKQVFRYCNKDLVAAVIADSYAHEWCVANNVNVKVKCKTCTEVIDKAVEATCMTTGLTEGKHCSVCGTVIVAQEIVKASGHSWTAATCASAKTCSACGATEGEALGHAWDESAVTAPTCEEAGYTTYTCSGCGDSYVEAGEGALGHDYEGKVTTEPTCMKAGVRTYTCKNDAGHTYTEAVAELGHSYEGIVTAPTCEEAGYTTYTCSVCGDSYVEEGEGALGHAWNEGVITTKPTCTEAGVKTYTCKNDAGHTYTEAVPELGHSHAGVVTDPTCEADGYTTYTCSGCGDSYMEEGEGALGHAWNEGVITTKPTCTEAGVKTYTCKNDAGHAYTEAVPTLGHSYESTVTAPTCEEAGYTTYTCSGCGDSYVADEVMALGHKEVTDAAVVATCTTAGKTEGKHCSVCGTVTKAQTTIAALGHKEVTDAAVAATCTTAGKAEGKRCSVCGTVTKAQTTIAALGHKEVTDEAVAATCTTAGKTEGKHCSVCGTVTKTQTTIAALGHKEVTDEAVAATCTTAGKTEGKHCSVCGTVTKKRETIAAGHTVVTDPGVEPTYSEPGLTEGSHCGVCGAILVTQKEIPMLIREVSLTKKGSNISIKAQMGEPIQLIAPFAAENGWTVKSWKSSNKKIASVDSAGMVTTKTEGTVTITVTTNNKKKATIKIKITDAYKPKKVKLDKTGTQKLNIGETLLLKPILSPENAKATFKWKSSSKKIAKVENGVITPVGEGTATITVTATRGKVKKTATVKVKVTDPKKPSKVSLDLKGTQKLNLGETLQLNATLTPDTAEAKFTWKTSSKKIATVKDGLVTPVAEGTATITVTATRGKVKKTASVKVKVEDPLKLTKVSLDKSGTQKLAVGESLTLTPTLNPEGTEATIKWKSSNKKVASVVDGVVTARKKGKAVITVTAVRGKVTKTAKVTVQVK